MEKSSSCSHLDGVAQLPVLILQVDLLLLKLRPPPQQPPLLLLPHCTHTQSVCVHTHPPPPYTHTCLVGDVGLDEVVGPGHVLLVQDLQSSETGYVCLSVCLHDHVTVSRGDS